MEKTDLTEVINFIKGKSIAIVGNSVSIFNSKYGKEIDNHDVVIRFNKGFPDKPESQGTRTDILILACKLSNEEMKKYNPKYTIRRLNVPEYDFTCDYVFLYDFIHQISGGLGARPSSGLMAIEFALRHEAKKVDVYGFTFFKDATYYNPEGYITKHCGETEEKRIIGYYNDKKLNIFPKPTI